MQVKNNQKKISVFSEETNTDMSTRGNTKDTHKGSVSSAHTVLKSQKYTSEQIKGIKKLSELLSRKIYNHELELWLNLKTAEPLNTKMNKEKPKRNKIEELAACDISGIDLIDEQYDRKQSISNDNRHSKNYEPSLINETCNEILESMAENSSSVRPIEFGDSHVDEENESSDEEVNVYDYDDQEVDMGKVHEELKNDIEDLGKNMADLLK